MKTASLFAILLACFQVHAAETSISTKAEPTAAPKAPKYSFSYAYYHYDMEGTSTANTKIYKFGNASVDLQLYTLTWFASPAWTVMTFIPVIRNEVETIYEPVARGLNLALTDKTEGLGDVRVMAMRPMIVSARYVSLFDVGFTVPTGKTNESFTSNPSQRASYNMQLGSGTPDLIGGLTSSHFTTKEWVQTVRVQYTERLGRNSQGWALGNELQANASSKYQLLSWLNTGAQFNFKNRDKVRGRNARYEIMNNYPGSAPGVASGDGHQYYHQPQTNYDVTAMVKADYRPLKWLATSIEVGAPLWQDAQNADNIRLDTKYFVSGSASATF